MKLLCHMRRATLFALLCGAVGSSGCQAQYAVRETDLPPEVTTPANCPDGDCLVVSESSVYCSVDPFELREGRIFSTKSELRLPAGTYPLVDAGSLSDLTINLTTPVGERVLRPEQEEVFSFHRDEPDEVTNIEPLEWIEVKSPYRGEGITLERFFLRTSRWPHDQFHLGDPEDIRWFFEAARNLYIRLSGETDLYPGLSGETILFAPCSMRDLPDRPFSFRFEDGSTLNLRVRVISGTQGIGYYVGRLMEVEGELAGRPVRVDALKDLAFFGSTRSWSEMAIPTFAVRTADEGAACGIILDTSDWESGEAVDGYTAYEMTCDEHRGRPLPLSSVSYPDVFGLP